MYDLRRGETVRGHESAVVVRLGVYSFVLLVGALHGLLVATLLLFRRVDRIANRFLAALLVLVVLRLVPFIIGYAGVYDVAPWMSFAPFELSLGYGPLIYLYVATLTSGRRPSRWIAHLAPVALQALYYCAIFAQPLAFKNTWNARIHEPWIDPLENVLTVVSIATYLWLSVLRYRAYGRYLRDERSDRDTYELVWIRNFLVAFAVTLALMTGFIVVRRFVRPLNYFDVFPLYVWYTLLVYYLGMDGWRVSGRAVERTRPRMESAIAHDAVPQPDPRDWRELGESWNAAIVVGEYWRDPEITLALVAQKLGTNTTTISRAINLGLGQNFNEMMNRHRVAAIQRVLDDPSDKRDLLKIAIDAGFRSKASFNRAFATYAAMTPGEYRKRTRSPL